MLKTSFGGGAGPEAVPFSVVVIVMERHEGKEIDELQGQDEAISWRW